MILNVHYTPKFIENIEALRRQGGKSLTIAKKADRLIKEIVARGRNELLEVGRLTKRGELRIKRCRKYDLGDGYRLICLKEGKHLILLYVGTHDECSRWLERNKGLRYKIDDVKGTIVETREVEVVALAHTEERDPAYEYEEQLMGKIDDKILRKIFYGLCK
jgi:hypothetical protein